jgi:acetate kinase
MDATIAVLNTGSSSIKFAVHEASANAAASLRGQIQGIGSKPSLAVRNAAGEVILERSWPTDGLDHSAATRQLLEIIVGLVGAEKVTAVGHRVVHGGTTFDAPMRVDQHVLFQLERCIPLAPLHQPHNLAPIRTIAEHAPQLPQVACFDTAFHRGQAAVVQRFGLPRHLHDAGVRRYGFHGLSYEFIAARLRELAPHLATGRVVAAHLGNGASLCAMHDGRSVASTMGFTAVDGLMMGTRCGALDPGVLIYLMDEYRMDARGIEDLLYLRSGLLGVSGLSSDMRTLRTSVEPAAAEAIELFVHRIVREIGSMAATLGGIDGLVFTGGIGENDAMTRAEVMRGCSWLGLQADEVRNLEQAGRISAAESRVEAWVVRTDEERMIAYHTAALLGLGSDIRETNA